MTEEKPARTPTPQRVAGQSRACEWIAIFGLLAGVYRGVIWPWFRRWGATDAEVRAPFPGADLIPAGKRGGTMAVTIDAPPSRAWSRLVRMGRDPSRLVQLGPARQRRSPERRPDPPGMAAGRGRRSMGAEPARPLLV